MVVVLQVRDVFGAATLGRDRIFSECARLGVTAVELAASTIEEYLGKPDVREPWLEMPENSFETGALPLEEEVLRDEVACAQQTVGEILRQWRLSASLEPLASLRQQAAEGGVRIEIVRWIDLARLSDPEVDWAFSVAKALGASVVAMPLIAGDPRRLAPFADRHAMTVAFEGGSATRSADFEGAMRHSPFHAASIDLRAWMNGDHGSPLRVLRQHADSVMIVRIDAENLADGALVESLGEVALAASASGRRLLVTVGLEGDTPAARDRLARIGRALSAIRGG